MNELILGLDDFIAFENTDETGITIEEMTMELPDRDTWAGDYAFPANEDDFNGVPLPRLAYRDVRPLCFA